VYVARQSKISQLRICDISKAKKQNKTKHAKSFFETVFRGHFPNVTRKGEKKVEPFG
jgi:hypothetical protein